MSTGPRPGVWWTLRTGSLDARKLARWRLDLDGDDLDELIVAHRSQGLVLHMRRSGRDRGVGLGQAPAQRRRGALRGCLKLAECRAASGGEPSLSRKVWHVSLETKQPPPGVPKGVVQSDGRYWTKFELLRRLMNAGRMGFLSGFGGENSAVA